MTGADVNAWFTPFHYFVYLGIILIGMILSYQWKWAQKVDKYVKLIVVKPDGSSDTDYALKEGSSVAITNPKTGTVKLWPITDVATIEMLYPGDGFIPVFLQKKIRTTIVDENDWEPLLNRGAYSDNVASPDVKAKLREIAETLDEEDKTRKQLLALSEGLKTAPTREMIGSPAILGNIAKEKVSELAVTVAKDVMNPLQEAIKKLGKQLNPTIVYIGLGLVAILLVYAVFQLQMVSNTGIGDVDIGKLTKDVELIKQALGVK